uniref:FZ domain-containing protein n=1 Tax=Glossina palpalis gambiensis TaxID=67801 RepID=A0A1B0ANH3_9MUSC
MKDYRLFFLATLGLYTAYTETEALVTSAGSVALAAQTPNGLQCQRITVSACQGLGYNMTAMPNLAGHTNQLEAELRVRGTTL